MPVTCPELTAVAIAVLLLVHDSDPDVASVSAVMAPAHIVNVPVMAAGLLKMVLGYVTKQPEGIVYVITAVPAEPPEVIMPVAPMVAPPEQLHVPPGVRSLNVTVVPAHSEVIPCTGVGLALTVITLVATHPTSV
jgi:hypothetical protein